MTMTGSYTTLFTSATNVSYIITILTNTADGTYGTFISYIEDATITQIGGNNIYLIFSGSNIQIKSSNGANYNISWSALRLL